MENKSFVDMLTGEVKILEQFGIKLPARVKITEKSYKTIEEQRKLRRKHV